MTSTVQVCIRIPIEKYDEYKKIKEKSGLSIARLIELELNGYRLEKMNENSKNKERMD